MNYVTVQICFITFCNHKNRNLKKATREQSKSNSEYIYILPHRIFYSKKLPVKASTICFVVFSKILEARVKVT